MFYLRLKMTLLISRCTGEHSIIVLMLFFAINLIPINIYWSKNSEYVRISFVNHVLVKKLRKRGFRQNRKIFIGKSPILKIFPCLKNIQSMLIKL